MELSFQTDHPEVPKMIETIVKLYSMLQAPIGGSDKTTTKTVTGKSSLDHHSQPAKVP